MTSLTDCFINVFHIIRSVKTFARNGINNGLHLVLDAETFDYSSPIKGKEGFLFTTLHHLDIAILKQTGSVAMPGQAIQVAITPTLTTTKASTKYRFDPEDRQCYFDDEITLTHLPSFGFRYNRKKKIFNLNLAILFKGMEC